MEKLSSNSIYDYNTNQLQEVRALNGYKDAKQMSQALDSLKDWIRKQNHFALKDFDRGYLERLIILNKGSIERTKKRLDKICTLRHLNPEFLCNFDIKNEFNNYRDCVRVCLFPKPTKDHYRVLYATVIKEECSFDIVEHFRYVSLIHQYGAYNDYCMGIEVIFDLQRFTFGMMSKLNITDSQRGLVMMLQSFGGRIKGIHIIVASKVLDGLLTIIKACLSDKLKERFLVHSSYESVRELIEKSVLPVEIGGEYKRTIKDLSDELFKELCSESNIARMKHLDRAVTIESQRLGTTFNEEYSGMPGSFKSLSVD